jgi:hypothetical protein
MSNTEDTRKLEQYTTRNTEFLSRVLAYGDEEARGYALALLANGASVDEIDQIQSELEEIRRKVR